MNINRLKAHRIKNDYTQEELAKKVGVSRQYLCDVENGKYPISDKIGLRCAEVFGVTVDEIKGETVV